MEEPRRFHYESLQHLCEELDRLGLDLPVSEGLAVLGTSVRIGPREAPNRLAIQPMEGADCSPEGTPGELTRRRYLRFAAGGAGLIWFEACAVAPSGRANPRQMMLTEQNVEEFRRLLGEIRQTARHTLGPDHEPVLILQLTHSGRFSRPGGLPRPVLVHHSPTLDRWQGLSPDYPLATDEELDRLQEDYLRAAGLAARAGFDGVDVKACHGYLISELLASFTRTESRYGGADFRHRTRFLRRVHARIAAEQPELIATCRLNLWDPIPYPHGWGVDRGDARRMDLSEPLRLAGQLREQGAPCLNVTVGHPRFVPRYNRPHDPSPGGKPVVDEHPLVSVERMLRAAGQVQRACPQMVIVGTGYSYLRQFLPCFAAGAVQRGWATMIGLGREAFAYPDFARDVLEHGKLDPEKCCITCSLCSRLMKAGKPAGCVVRDGETYGPIYREVRGRRPPDVD